MMVKETCPNCGLPQAICVCTDIDRSETDTVVLSVEERRYNKQMTIVENVSESDLSDLASDLKSAVGAGGTTENGEIHIQGDHIENSNFVSVIEDYGYTTTVEN
jgi:translation initiation factor 1